MKFKKLLLTSLVMGSISFIGLGSKVYAMTVEEGVRWAERQVREGASYTNKHGAQCVVLIQEFTRQNFGIVVHGDAIELLGKFQAKSSDDWEVGWGGKPRRGDIVVWKTPHIHGHVGIATSDADHKGNFTSVEQNVNNNPRAIEINRSTGTDPQNHPIEYRGYIRPPYFEYRYERVRDGGIPGYRDLKTGQTIYLYEHQTPSEEK